MATYNVDALADLLEQVQDEGNPRLFTDMAQAVIAVPGLPTQWSALAASDNDPLGAMLRLWQGLDRELPLTRKMMERKLVGFALLVTDTVRASLLYLFDEGRDLMAQRGHWPVDVMPAVASKLVADLKPFYRLHDGWINLFGGEGGPLPSTSWKVIGKAPGVEGFLEIYSNGSQSVGFDLDGSPAKCFSMDTADDDIEAVADFWAELDARLAAGLKSFPNVR